MHNLFHKLVQCSSFKKHHIQINITRDSTKLEKEDKHNIIM